MLIHVHVGRGEADFATTYIYMYSETPLF